MTESKMYSHYLVPFFKEHGVFYHRIESPMVPDIFVCKNGIGCWLEMKCIHHRSGVIAPSWRPGQLSWLRVYGKVGGGPAYLVLWYVGEIYFLKPQVSYSPGELECQKKEFLMMLNPQRKEQP